MTNLSLQAKLHSETLNQTFLQRESVKNLWSQVPPEVFENAHATIGLFEKSEINVVASALESRVNLANGNKLYLLGCATAMRETQTLCMAGIKAEKDIHFSEVIAVDIAEQFLVKAEERLKHLQKQGVFERVAVENCSLEDLSLISNSRGTVVLGIYDLQCLLYESSDGDSSVGFEEYGRDMAETLGTVTKIKPLINLNGELHEEEPLLIYDSADERYLNGFSEVRAHLLDKIPDKDLLGLRVYISKTETPEIQFVSTWFNPLELKRYFTQQGAFVDLLKSEISSKGLVVILRGENKESITDSVSLLMNNVFGNLATPDLMQEVSNSLSRFTKSEYE